MESELFAAVFCFQIAVTVTLCTQQKNVSQNLSLFLFREKILLLQLGTSLAQIN